MHLRSWILLGSLLPLVVSNNFIPHRPQYATYNYYVLEHDPSAPASLADVAQALGVQIVQELGVLRNHWLARIILPTKRDGEDPVLASYRQLQTRAASSRNLVGTRSVEAIRARDVVSSVRAVLPQTLRKRIKRDGYYAERAPPPLRPTKGDKNETSPAHAMASRLGIEDPIFPEQWHFVNEEFPQHMMNVTAVWEELGITGKGVYVAMVDDGVDYEHHDIKDNFFIEGSYDFNDHEALPKPKLRDDHHGTRCAGEISAVKNDVCGVGIAYQSKIAGLRILSGPISDVDEALALNYAYQNTSIYSCSWGPPDNGRAMEAPGYLIQKAVVEGITNGRNGKGSIFVFASGNGAASGDQCNFDGYTNSIFSVTVAAVDHQGLHPYYSEPCAANMVVTYSSGGGKNIVTTDIGQDKCAYTHGGTSAAAPIASAVFALALEARPELTWRDIQHLCVRTGLKINPDDPDWERTATGRPYSYKYGYGRLDAWQYVKAAQTWDLVKPQAWVDMPLIELGGGRVDNDEQMLGGQPIISGGIKSTMKVTHDTLMANNFELLEHVTVKVWINHTKRGDVEVEIISPNGIRSVLAGPRTRDSSGQGFLGWTFMSIKHWGENPIGNWTIRVFDQGIEGSTGTFLGWTMGFFGSSIDPAAAVPYTLNTVTASPGNPLPPPPPTPTDGNTKTHAKPTAHLPGDHSEATGEAHKPTFGDSDTSAPSTTPDEGYFTGMSRLLKNSKWLIGAIGIVILFGIGAAIFFWRRHKRLSQDPYEPVDGDEYVPMMGRGERPSGGLNRDRGRTKELYDAFGEGSDDEGDEEAAMRRPLDSGGIGYHSGFLEDEDPNSAKPYKDEPDADRGGNGQRTTSPGSNDDGSWEHASQQAKPE
ncbi:peptidase S8/S53 domain-containing protein [Hysterangium stoloniferum]|nr:peptidase S8/S53 domain-containing protein [Hysterangium stoloniferum]